MKKVIYVLFTSIILICLTSCSVPTTPKGDKPTPNTPSIKDEPEEEVNTEIDSNPTLVTPETDYQITYISGTEACYEVTGNTITFSDIKEDTIYQISGSLDGNIIVDCINDFKLELELSDFTMSSTNANPITVLSGKEFQLTAKKDTANYIYDYRETVDSLDESLYSACIYSLIDLDISGKGKLEVYSDKNNGIHTKDDLQIKNVTLNVVCMDNALKGNDSVTIESGAINLVAKTGDGIKTTNSHINNNVNQKGYVNVLGGTINIYAACDGIDSSYDVVVENAFLNIYTDKYSSYSGNVTETVKSVYFIRYSSNSYKFSVKYYNSQTKEEVWFNATGKSQSGRYYFYEVEKPSGYDKLVLYMYSSNQTLGQESNYYKKFDMSINNSYDTMAVSSRGSCDWINYNQTQSGPGGMGGFNDGNSDKGTYSTKGIKADNQIIINSGNIQINSYDDSIHASGDNTLENGAKGLGNVTINGGELSLYSNDDGIHADYILMINDGTINITNSYEGIEGTTVSISGGNIGIVSKDDGVNATTSTGTAISLSGGSLYIFANGDGIDSNSSSSNVGIVFKGCNVVVISTSSGNSAIDTERGYTYTSGMVLAVMPSGGMSGESSNTTNFNNFGTKKTNLSLSNGSYLNVDVSSKNVCTVKMPTNINSALAIYLGSNAATIATSTSTSNTLNDNGVYWG